MCIEICVVFFPGKKTYDITQLVKESHAAGKWSRKTCFVQLCSHIFHRVPSDSGKHSSELLCLNLSRWFPISFREKYEVLFGAFKASSISLASGLLHFLLLPPGKPFHHWIPAFFCSLLTCHLPKEADSPYAKKKTQKTKQPPTTSLPSPYPFLFLSTLIPPLTYYK